MSANVKSAIILRILTILCSSHNDGVWASAGGGKAGICPPPRKLGLSAV